MTRLSDGLTSRRRDGSLLASRTSLELQDQISGSVGAKGQLQASQNQTNERAPLLNSFGAGAGSLVNNSVVGGDVGQGVSWGIAAFLLVNTALGAGMLNYPYAYNQIGGIWAAALMQVVLLVFISSTMFILVYCADFNQDNTYHDVLLSMCGKRAQQISALSILLTCYGINITFLVIIGDQYDRIFHSLMPEYVGDFWFLDRKFTIFMTSVLFIWPMCYAQRLDFLRYASILGMFAMLYVAFLTVYEHYVLDEATIAAVTSGHLPLAASAAAQISTTNATSNQLPTSATNETLPSSTARSVRLWLEPLAIVPVLCFAYQTHEVIVPVYACMRERFIASFMKASFFGLVILFFLYNLVGAFGYLTFGENVGPDIMSLYDGKDPIVVVGIVALVVKFITTYPPLMFCGRSALDGLYGELRQLSSDEFKQNEKCRRIVISTLWFFSTVVLAAFAPDISVTLQLLGSMASINVFVFPGMCLVSLTHRLRCARQALLMGEVPNEFQTMAGSCGQQRAKDYHLISGSYFGAAMKRRQQLQQQQQLYQNSLANHLIGGNHAPLAPSAQQQCNGLANDHSCGKHFSATFASLVEFENNMVKSTRSNDDQHLHGAHNSLLLNGHSAMATEAASAPIASSSSNSSSGLQLSTSAGQQQLARKQLRNGYGTNGDTNKTNGSQQLARARIRQEEFERLITNGSCGAETANGHHLSSSGCDGCHRASRPINDSHEDYSDCDDVSTHLHQHNYDNNNKRQQIFNSLSSSFKQFINSNHKLQLASTNCSDDLLASGNDKRSAANLPASLSTLNSHRQHHQHLQATCNNHYAEQSITNSLINKFGSSIAPSTVAQIGISRCAALGLYSFSGLLIAFGAFIFVLELVDVFGLISD